MHITVLEGTAANRHTGITRETWATSTCMHQGFLSLKALGPAEHSRVMECPCMITSGMID